MKHYIGYFICLICIFYIGFKNDSLTKELIDTQIKLGETISQNQEYVLHDSRHWTLINGLSNISDAIVSTFHGSSALDQCSSIVDQNHELGKLSNLYCTRR